MTALSNHRYPTPKRHRGSLDQNERSADTLVAESRGVAGPVASGGTNKFGTEFHELKRTGKSGAFVARRAGTKTADELVLTLTLPSGKKLKRLPRVTYQAALGRGRRAG